MHTIRMRDYKETIGKETIDPHSQKVKLQCAVNRSRVSHI